jgi:hypothetical protein
MPAETDIADFEEEKLEISVNQENDMSANDFTDEEE